MRDLRIAYIPFERGAYVDWDKSTQNQQMGEKLKVFPNCAKCETFIETASEAWSSYQTDKVRVVPSNEMVVSVDMQKAIMLPRLPDLKQPIFCKYLVLFNETFTTTGKSEMKPVGILWHEAIKGRSTEDAASTFTFFICNFQD